MKIKARFTWLFIPLAIYLALMAILLIERTGIQYEAKAPALTFLEPGDLPLESPYTDPAVESLVLYDSSRPDEEAIEQAVTEVLGMMRVRYDLQDVNSPGSFSFDKYSTVVLAFEDLSRFRQAHEMVTWVENGGRVLFATPPARTDTFASIYRKIGIRALGDHDVEALGVAFTSGLLPGAEGVRLEGTPEYLNSNSYPVQLEADCRVHITSADEYALPLLWEKDHGQGRFVVMNSDLFSFRVNRGIMSAGYSLLQDAFVYPVINSSVFFVDDFPAPIPEGDNPVISKEFHRDVRSFMLNVWWPDMHKISEKYGIKYTGLLVESYNDKVVPPFDQDVSVDDHRYLGRLLIKNGGEVGLHGYNHVPFCQKKDGINQMYEYPVWPSVNEGQIAIQTLDELGRTLFPGQKMTAYVPPSNILCPEAREWLPKALPDLKVISSLLLEEEDKGTYQQNFEEAADGIIEFPRIVSGYYLYEDGQLALLNGLGMHYVNSLFIHPDDILDPVRRADRTWGQMREQFEDQVKWLSENVPSLRPATVSEGAIATQRYSRLKVNASLEEDTYTIRLGNFYDEAWLMLRTNREPVGITGGTFTKVTSSLYLIQASQPEVIVQLRK